MKVKVERAGEGFKYRLEPEAGDQVHARRTFTGIVEDPIRLSGDGYEVRLPSVFVDVHPDLHAGAIHYTLKPFIGQRLLLPFGVSSEYAEFMAGVEGVELPNVDSTLSLREAPSAPRPCLLFSGGMDSAAAAMVLPRETTMLFYDRIIDPGDQRLTSNVLLDLIGQRGVAREMQLLGRDLHVVADNHEEMISPFPTWHSEMSRVAPLYMADTLRVKAFETGDVLGIYTMRGYTDGQAASWRFKDVRDNGSPQSAEKQRSSRHEAPSAGDGWGMHGLRKASCISGLSEVATAFAVARSPLRGKTFSCYYKTSEGFCMRCDKCFKKILLLHIADGQETAPELFEHFLSQPRLRAIFERPFFDWHHVWFYLFQKLRCTHPFVKDLQRQAQKGPDVGFLAKWYPGKQYEIPEAYREEVVGNIDRLVGIMTPEEIVALTTMDLPPLMAPTS